MRKFIVIALMAVVASPAFAKPPKVSGNYEQGSRYALEIDEEDYYCRKLEDV